MKLKKLRQFANQFNNDIFNNFLELPKLEINRSLDCFGMFIVLDGGRQKIQVNPLKHKNNVEYADTIAHELIHAYQYQTCQELDHGHEFTKHVVRIYNCYNYILDGWKNGHYNETLFFEVLNKE